MAKEEITLSVKSDISATTKDVQGLASEFKVMGVSLNTIKSSLKSVGTIAKSSFKTITMGIKSTGIGLLVIAFGSLVTFLTKTKRGAEILEVAFAGLSATFNVIVDRVSKFGGAIVKLFQGKGKEALQDVKGAFVGIGEEIRKDTKDAIALKQATVNLRDSQRELNVETARQRSEIERLKLIAEDVTKSEQERLDAAQQAFKIENDLLDKRVANAEENLRITKEENAIGESSAEDLDREAQAEIDLFNIKQESITKQIELNNKINAIKKEAETKRLQAIEDEKKAEEEALAEKEKREQEAREKKEKEEEEAREKKRIADEKAAQDEIDLENAVEGAKEKLIQQGFSIAEGLTEKSDKMSKAVAVAKTIYNTQQAIMQTMANVPAPFNTLQAVATGIMGAMSIQKILSTTPDSASASGGATASGGGGTPAPQMVSGAFDLSGVTKPEPVQAFVVTDDMTDSQDKLATIRRRATI